MGVCVGKGGGIALRGDPERGLEGEAGIHITGLVLIPGTA